MSTYSPWREDRYAPLAERHEQLRRTSLAMWRLLKTRFDLNDEELRYSVARVEREIDSPSSHEVSETQLLDCRVCRHPIQSTAKCCLYCGTSPRPKAVSMIAA